MDIIEYLEKTYPDKSPRERYSLFAERLETSPEYVYQLATGRRRSGPDMTRRIITESGGLITLADLRPDYVVNDSELMSEEQAPASK